MKLLFKQRFFSWFDSYDIYDEAGSTMYVVKGQLSWGHCLKIFDPTGSELGMVKRRVFTLPPKFDLYRGATQIGSLKKEFSLFQHRYNRRLQRLACGGRLVGLGLFHCRRQRQNRQDDHQQGAFELDGHLCH